MISIQINNNKNLKITAGFKTSALLYLKEEKKISHKYKFSEYLKFNIANIPLDMLAASYKAYKPKLVIKVYKDGRTNKSLAYLATELKHMHTFEGRGFKIDSIIKTSQKSNTGIGIRLTSDSIIIKSNRHSLSNVVIRLFISIPKRRAELLCAFNTSVSYIIPYYSPILTSDEVKTDFIADICLARL